MEVKPGIWDSEKKCPFPLNRGVPSTYVTDKKIIRIFARGPNFASPE